MVFVRNKDSTTNSVSNDQSQVPLRQLARKGGIFKTEAAADLKKGGSAPSIAEAVKEGMSALGH